jgi:hypothetical protein
LTFLLVHSACYVMYADQQLQDASHYVQAGRLLLMTGQIDEYFHEFYFVPIAVMALFTQLFADPQAAFILFQIAVSAVAVFALYRTVETISSSRAAFFSCLLYLLWLDNIRWNVLVMSESLFGSIVILVLYTLSHYREGFRSGVLLFTLVIVAVFTRPTGMLMVVAAIAFLMHRHHVWIAASKYWSMGACLLIIFILTWSALKLSHTWDFTDQYFRGNVITYADTWPGDKTYIQLDPGNIDEERQIREPIMKAIIFVVYHPGHVFMVSALKLFYLLSGIRPYYSLTHNLGTMLWMTLIYVGFGRGLRAVRSSPFKTAVLALIVVNCLLVAATTADWDNRFYIPMEAGVIVLASVGYGGRVGRLVAIRKNLTAY